MQAGTQALILQKRPHTGMSPKVQRQEDNTTRLILRKHLDCVPLPEAAVFTNRY